MNIKKNPLVSIVIPSYNHGKFIGRAIESVLSQTYQTFEVIVIDNHSKDETDKVLNKFRDNRIKVLKIHNKGIIAISRNRGIKEAKGEWVAFLDSDDVWYPKKLEILLGLATNESNYDLLCSDELKVNIKNGKKKLQVYGPVNRSVYHELLFLEILYQHHL